MREPAIKPSSTIHRFAAPLIGVLGVDPKIERVRQVLGVAIDVWNACILDDWEEGDHYLDIARAKVLGEFPELSDSIDGLIERKQGEFAADDWGVSAWRLEGNGDEGFRLEVEARHRS